MPLLVSSIAFLQTMHQQPDLRTIQSIEMKQVGVVGGLNTNDGLTTNKA
jgi:hypothetical protein